MAPNPSTINTVLFVSCRSTNLISRKFIPTASPSTSAFPFAPLPRTLLHQQPHRGISGFLIRSGGLQDAVQRTRLGSASSSKFYSTVVVHNRGKARFRRTVSFLIISTLSFFVGGYYALTYAPPILSPLIMGSMPTDTETLALYEPPDDFCREVDEHIRNSELARSLRANPDFKESRPHLKIPPAVRQHNLTAGTLSGPGMLVVPPYYFNEKDGKSMVQIFYVGGDVCGHPGLVHGGFLATMLDEGLARCAFPAMPNKVGVTASLEINYLKPTQAGQFLVLKAKTTKVEGRKAWSEGWIESLEVAEGEEPTKLVAAKALFIEPKHAKVLQSLYKVTE